MVGSKSRLPVPAGFTDFKWKKGRFISNYNDNKYRRHVYQVYDTKTDDRWFIDYNCNNLHTDDLGIILNNLYERNGYLRRECSKQTFLANKYKKDADMWRRLYDNMVRRQDATQKEVDDWYNRYQLLKMKIEKEQQETNWDDIKRS